MLKTLREKQSFPLNMRMPSTQARQVLVFVKREMVFVFKGDRPYTVCASEIYVNGKLTTLDAITPTDANGGAHNYFKLRDVGKALGFNVSWDGTSGKIVINPNEAYSDAA